MIAFLRELKNVGSSQTLLEVFFDRLLFEFNDSEAKPKGRSLCV